MFLFLYLSMQPLPNPMWKGEVTVREPPTFAGNIGTEERRRFPPPSLTPTLKRDEYSFSVGWTRRVFEKSPAQAVVNPKSSSEPSNLQPQRLSKLSLKQPLTLFHHKGLGWEAAYKNAALLEMCDYTALD